MSVSTTLLTAVILVALAVGAGVPAGIANIVAVLCGIGPSYIGNRRFVWRRAGRGSVAREVVPFWTLSLAGLAASTISVARVASWSEGRSASLRAIALPAANLSIFGALWIVQFLVCDRLIFRPMFASVPSRSLVDSGVPSSADRRFLRRLRTNGEVVSNTRVRAWAKRPRFLAVLLLAAVAVPIAVARSVTATGAPSGNGLSVFVGYAEDKEINTPDPASFPVPWAGAPHTLFLGGTVPGQAACGSLTVCYDAGAIRLDNPGSTPIVVDRVSVDDHSSISGGKLFNNLWGSFTVPAGQSVILTENPPANNPGFDNFDTSSYPNNNCTPVTIPPTVTITVGGVATVLADSTHVLDTGGIDAGSCSPKRNESIQWRSIGAAGTSAATLSLGPATSSAFAGNPTTETATLLDGAGGGLPNVTVNFAVTSGPDAGVSGTALTDGVGHAAFTYAASAEGEDTVVASVTTVGSFKSNSARVMWLDDAASGWSPTDVGGPTPAGGATLDTTTGTWTVQGGGGGIGGSSDQFQFVAKALSGTVGVGARVAALGSVNPGAKAGVMLRTSAAPTAAFYAAFATPGGIVVQERASSGATSVNVVGVPGTVPAYLWVRSDAGTVRAYGSDDGFTWSPVPGSAVALDLGANLLGGLAVTSNDSTQLNTSTIDRVAVGAAAPGPVPPLACPAPWSCADIGNPTPAGSQSFDPNSATWTLIAGGSDITGSADHFRFVWQTLTGDGSVSARVLSQTNSSSNAKAGVMLRASTDPAAPNYAVLVSPGAGIKVQVRTVLGGTTAKIANPAGTTPAWLKVSRSGNTFTAYTSADGITWNPIAGSTFTMTLGATLLEGLAATSHNSGALSTVVMNNVTTT